MTIKDLLEKRNKLISEARSKYDELQKRALEDGGTITAEDEAQVDRMFADVDKIDKLIERENRLQNIERSISKPTDSEIITTREAVNDGETRGDTVIATEEYRAAFDRYMRDGDVGELRSMTVGTNNKGGFTVPTPMLNRLVQGLNEENFMRSLATVVPVSSKSIKIPSVSSHGAATIVAEEGEYQEADETIGQTDIVVYKFGRMVKVSEELLQDSIFDLSAYLAAEFARSLGAGEHAKFINGTGSSQPQGLTYGASLGKSFAGQAAITADELIELYHSLASPYRARATWVVNDSTALVLRKLKNATTGDYMWQPGLQAGKPDRLLGQPVYTSGDMPAAATGNKSVIFGDLSYYYIANHTAFNLKRNEYLYQGNGQVGFFGTSRAGGAVTLSAAIKYGIQA